MSGLFIRHYGVIKDVYELGLDENPSRVIGSVGLTYYTSDEKIVELFRNIVLN